MPDTVTAKDVLRCMSESRNLADEVLFYLSYGMQVEWDCTLPQGLENGFGDDELRIAAKAGFDLLSHNEQEQHD